MVDLYLALPEVRPAGAELNLHRLDVALTRRGHSVSRVHPPPLLSGHLQIEKAAFATLPPFTAVLRRAVSPEQLGAPVVTATVKSDVVGYALRNRWICNAQTDIPWHSRHAGRQRGRLLVDTWKRMVRRASVVVAPSQLYAETLVEDRLASPEQVRVIPNIIPSFVGPLRVGAPHVVWVGRLVAQKDVMLALKTIGLMDAIVRLTIVGDGPLRAETERAASEATLRGRVRCIGWVDDPASIIAAHQVLLNTSHTETFGNVMGEALAAGTRVVATPTDGARYFASVVGEGVTVATRRDPEELAVGLRTALDRGPLDGPPGRLEQMSADSVAARWESLL